MHASGLYVVSGLPARVVARDHASSLLFEDVDEPQRIVEARQTLNKLYYSTQLAKYTKNIILEPFGHARI